MAQMARPGPGLVTSLSHGHGNGPGGAHRDDVGLVTLLVVT